MRPETGDGEDDEWRRPMVILRAREPVGHKGASRKEPAGAREGLRAENEVIRGSAGTGLIYRRRRLTYSRGALCRERR